MKQFRTVIPCNPCVSPSRAPVLSFARYFLVSLALAAVFSIVTQLSSPHGVGALRDDTKNGCEGD